MGFNGETVKYNYIGCFLQPESFYQKIEETFGRERLSRQIEFPHITMAYRPEQVDETLFGEKVKVLVTGYGKDELNEGVSVAVTSDNPKVREMLQDIDTPHITLSVDGEHGKTVNTRFLTFSPCVQIEFQALVGGYAGSKPVVNPPVSAVGRERKENTVAGLFNDEEWRVMRASYKDLCHIVKNYPTEMKVDPTRMEDLNGRF